MSRIPDTHAEAWSLLPWLANGRLAAVDREWVEAHVHDCADCKAELASQRALAVQMRESGPAPGSADADEQRSFDKLWSRIEASQAVDDRVTHRIAGGQRVSRTVRWLAAAVIVQGVGLALFGFNALRNSTDSKFMTVSSVEPTRSDAPALRIVFAPEAPMGAVNTLLANQGLTLVAGPGAAGNFTAALSADAVAAGASAESVASVLARDPHVSFAQPVAR